MYEEAILSPTVRRSFNQTINVLNTILKKYINKNKDDNQYIIDNITIELPRESNSYKQRKKIEYIQKENQKKLKKILNDNNQDENMILTNKQRERLILWDEQEKHDLYSKKEISFEDALSGKGLEVDHIIPHKISNDDSLNNKVLTYKEFNQNKKERTPYMWIIYDNDHHFKDFNDFKDHINKYGNNLSKTKKKNLLFIGDPYNNCEFIAKNLVDTSYASKLVLNNFQKFFKDNKNYENISDCNKVNIKVINGSLTFLARKKLFVIKNNINNYIPILFKNRDIYHHHAIDASIVCYLGMNYKIKNKLNLLNRETQDINKEIYDYNSEKKCYINKKLVKFFIRLKKIFLMIRKNTKKLKNFLIN